MLFNLKAAKKSCLHDIPVFLYTVRLMHYLNMSFNYVFRKYLYLLNTYEINIISIRRIQAQTKKCVVVLNEQIASIERNPLSAENFATFHYNTTVCLRCLCSMNRVKGTLSLCVFCITGTYTCSGLFIEMILDRLLADNTW